MEATVLIVDVVVFAVRPVSDVKNGYCADNPVTRLGCEVNSKTNANQHEQERPNGNEGSGDC